jgi:hypothetical protein
MALDNDLFNEFCEDYVVPQLRLQLVFTVEGREGIELCHIMPGSERIEADNLPEMVKQNAPPQFK